MSKIKVSILVPIYNSASFLQECLNSLAKQSMTELEFILVNDGSTDNSLDIMKKAQKEDMRFKIIDKKNTGYGDSLNRALKVAQGEYIGIVEPDDFCDCEMFETLYKLVKSSDADIAKGNYYNYCNGSTKISKRRYQLKGKKVFNPIVNFTVFYEDPSIWSAIYKRKMLEKNSISFLPTEGASYQDAGFNFKTLACAKKIAYIDKPLYYYRIDNPESSVKNSKKVMAVVKEYSEIEKFIKKLTDYDLLMKYCQVAKFGAYHWNILRLRKKEAREFIIVAREDFIKQKKKNNLVKAYFPGKYWNSLRLMLMLPPILYWYLLDLRKRLKDIIIRA